MRVLVTGASGFVGRTVTADLRGAGHEVRPVVRRLAPGPADSLVLGDIDQATRWRPALEGVDVVVHLAARVHLTGPQAGTLDDYRAVNTAGTLHLAREAVAAGVKRLVFVSTIGVIGNDSDHPLVETDPPAPASPYAVSKWEAESRLLELAGQGDLSVVILRPPLVYGPGAPGNFGRLMRLVRSRLPLPLAMVHNARSMIYVGNLAHVIRLSLTATPTGTPLFHVADRETVSTGELVSLLRRGLGRLSGVYPVPPGVLRLLARALGRGREIDQLMGSLTISIERAVSVLGWQPPYSMHDALVRTAEQEAAG